MWHSLRVWAGRAEPAPAGLSAGCSVLWFYASSYMEQPAPNVGNPAVIVKAHPFSAEPLGYRWSWASEFIFKIRIPIHFIWLRKFCNARVHFLISLGSTETEITIIHEIKKALQFNVWTWLFPFAERTLEGCGLPGQLGDSVLNAELFSFLEIPPSRITERSSSNWEKWHQESALL